jgi:hypothetical protein
MTERLKKCEIQNTLIYSLVINRAVDSSTLAFWTARTQNQSGPSAPPTASDNNADNFIVARWNGGCQNLREIASLREARPPPRPFGRTDLHPLLL